MISNKSSSRDPNLLKELEKIDKIEKSVGEMQAHLRFLLKRENEEEKKTQRIYESSIKAANFKLLHAENHLKVHISPSSEKQYRIGKSSITKKQEFPSQGNAGEGSQQSRTNQKID